MNNAIHKLFLLGLSLLFSCFLMAENLFEHYSRSTEKANEFFKIAEYDSALFYLKDNLHPAPDKIAYLQRLLKIADIYRIERKFDTAEFFLNKINNIKDSIPRSHDVLFEYKHLEGAIYADKGLYQEGVEVLEHAIHRRIALLGKPDTLMAKTYNRIGICHFYSGNLDSALVYYQIALDLAKKKGNPENDQVATCYQNIGIIYATQGDYELALEYFDDCMQLSEKLLAKYDPAIARIKLNLGRIYQILSQNDRALLNFKKAEEIYVNKFGENYVSLGGVYVNIGLLNFEQSNLDEAELYYNNALRIYDLNFETIHPDVSKIYNNLGLIYSSKKDHEKALEYFKKSLEIAKDPEFIIVNYRNIADAYVALGDFDSANTYYTRSIKRVKEVFGNIHVELGHSYIDYGEFLISINQHKKALTYFNSALGIFEENFPAASVSKSEVYALIGDCNFSNNENEKALKNYQLSLINNDFSFDQTDVTINPEINNAISPNLYIEVLLKKAEVFALFNDKSQFKHSLNCLRKAMDGLDKLKLNVGESSKLHLSNETRSAFDLVFNVLYSLFDQTGNKEYIQEAFRFAEKSKASVLLSSIRDLDAIKFSGIPVDLQRQERELREKISAYESLVYNERIERDPDSTKLSLWGYKLFNLNRQHDSLVSDFEENNPAYYMLRHNTSVISLNEVMDELKSDETMVEYILTDNTLFKFLINKEGFVYEKSSIDSSFIDDINLLNKTSIIDFSEHGKKEYKEYVMASNKVYNILFGGLEEFISGQNLIIVPDGILGYLPFEALVNKLPTFEEIDYRNLSYLLLNNPVSYTYSSTLLYNNSIDAKSGSSMLAFAPDYSNSEMNLNPLYYSEEEVLGIEKIYHGTVYLKEKASESRFKRIAPDYDILHLAMHTVLDDQNPMESKLIFSSLNDSLNDGYLNTYEIYGLELQAQMVVLSACNTGRGVLHTGEGIMSLARGFIYAGVPSIVMTLWEVEDNSGASIMNLFYKNLKEGMSKNKALQRAKLTYLLNAPQHRAHPYFWAAYVDIGDTAPIKGSFLSVYGVYLLIIFLLIVVVLFYRLRFVKNKK